MFKTIGKIFKGTEELADAFYKGCVSINKLSDTLVTGADIANKQAVKALSDIERDIEAAKVATKQD